MRCLIVCVRIKSFTKTLELIKIYYLSHNIISQILTEIKVIIMIIIFPD